MPYARCLRCTAFAHASWRSATSFRPRAWSKACSRTPKEIACKYFYDAEGSALFDAICALPEYYQTRTEVALLRRHAGEIAAPDRRRGGDRGIRRRRLAQGPHPAGRAGAARAAIRPIDISGAYLRDVARRLAADYPAPGHASGGGAISPCRLHLPPLPGGARRAGFFPGSTIGNFRPDAAMALLRRMREMLNGGGLLIGVDLVKDPAAPACRL